ncbi:hypothetical protein L211DRAFT_853901 [Terfezia boudieri ATCC MYA-4762]|uniref:Uncharacterized protein n=1 Tax=Terfezia boudieri ATCC MYA-4762 TaxID=1051890 RepID=A0A3N4L7W0_9PEZI|nr:hypothetical protein L211DRAFT_853901 [Terfezia boudieri ATCC MYA-4762]
MRSRSCQLWLHYLHAPGTASNLSFQDYLYVPGAAGSGYTTYTLPLQYLHAPGTASSGYTTYALPELPALATGLLCAPEAASSGYNIYALPVLPALATLPTRSRYCQLWLHYLHAPGTSSSGYNTYALPELPALATGTTTTYSRFSNSTANPRAFRTTMRSRGCQLWLHYLRASGTASSGYTTYALPVLPALATSSGYSFQDYLRASGTASSGYTTYTLPDIALLSNPGISSRFLTQYAFYFGYIAGSTFLYTTGLPILALIHYTDHEYEV